MEGRQLIHANICLKWSYKWYKDLSFSWRIDTKYLGIKYLWIITQIIIGFGYSAFLREVMNMF